MVITGKYQVGRSRRNKSPRKRKLNEVLNVTGNFSLALVKEKLSKKHGARSISICRGFEVKEI